MTAAKVVNRCLSRVCIERDLKTKCLLSVALLLSASTIDEGEAAKLMDEMAAEVKAEETALPKNNSKNPSSTKSTAAGPRKTTNPKDSAAKPASNFKPASRTVIKKTNASSSVPGVKPTTPGRSPVTSRRNQVLKLFAFIDL